ncbi:MAG: HAD-superfamily hydrolase, subfamily variant 1 [Herbinix sp.]|jgi:putative hydrolase of the HAD superfamily|nr:HAD-superfamily hydrolase, subfamily variant 1 [Herbinix sp.]
MKKPKMMMFDYGQTLIAESKFDGVAGTREVLKYATRNPGNVTAEEIQQFANTLNKDIGRFIADPRATNHVEVHNHSFQNYLYDYFDIDIDLSPYELETIFWDNASAGKPTLHIEKLLDSLEKEGIRTAVLSNISYSGRALYKRINSLLPENHFEYILATSEYVFRKPHGRIFELALRKAQLNAEDVWYCGDNAVFDVEGASAYGIFPVWYRGAVEEYNKMEPLVDCLTISDWNELMEYMKK